MVPSTPRMLLAEAVPGLLHELVEVASGVHLVCVAVHLGIVGEIFFKFLRNSDVEWTSLKVRGGNI